MENWIFHIWQDFVFVFYTFYLKSQLNQTKQKQKQTKKVN